MKQTFALDQCWNKLTNLARLTSLSTHYNSETPKITVKLAFLRLTLHYAKFFAVPARQTFIVEQ